jgi:hypothetical protein
MVMVTTLACALVLALSGGASVAAQEKGGPPPIVTLSPDAAPPQFEVRVTFSGCTTPGVIQLVSRMSGETLSASEFAPPSSDFLVPPHAPPGRYDVFVRCGPTTATAQFVVEAGPQEVVAAPNLTG